MRLPGDRRRAPRAETRLAALAIAGLLALAPARASAAPDPIGAVREAVSLPLRVAGDAIGGTTTLAATGLALVGDALALVDRAPGVRRVARGAPSRGVHHVAFALSWSGARALEALRMEDIDRLPELRAAFVDTRPGAGRLDLAAGAVEVTLLALRDALRGVATVGARAIGARRTADALVARRGDARDAVLGALAPAERGGP